MVGQSASMRRLFELIRRFAPVDAPVLITGETGTGKELAARAIHDRSNARDGRFVAINCAALPAGLIASELFGYEKGAFTGATARRIGLVEMAAGGSLFLDEIGDLPMDLQGHLLRFLQEGQIFRLGGREPVSVRTRVIAATHVDLRRAIGEGRFREDLFYRLNVLQLEIPPLRARDGDIELLAMVVLRAAARDLGLAVDGFSAAALAALCRHDWPGNVRELVSTVRRAAVMASGQTIGEADLALPAARESPRLRATTGPHGMIDPEAVRAALARCGQNRARAARELGIARITLYRALQRMAATGHTEDTSDET
ncbi:MAG TPA: sigma-54 dependent transcriptional regulator [Acidiphilium sp.]|jgi:DNA-binding NtrC family response regulator|uniref:sigma-54 interaction domain-containing protein n=1 Tax=unclassified Acidiphilium TaxID=2617493 RepID=UPI00157A4624|nr:MULTISPECIES: sigma-54 dependent transcriptional regulator [unclassified Acidiphilium]HQT59788.1 sigma-54 dependent transcriptional regulator [Acidiphilium sp.]HQU10846.1 sigma-54 dependent transcriptional regulator [Acidiphilium sp.]